MEEGLTVLEAQIGPYREKLGCPKSSGFCGWADLPRASKVSSRISNSRPGRNDSQNQGHMTHSTHSAPASGLRLLMPDLPAVVWRKDPSNFILSLGGYASAYSWHLINAC